MRGDKISYGTMMLPSKISKSCILMMVFFHSGLNFFAQNIETKGQSVVNICYMEEHGEVFYTSHKLDGGEHRYLVQKYSSDLNQLFEEFQAIRIDSCRYILNGELKAYNKDGSVWLITQFSNGFRNGSEYRYDESGGMQSHFRYTQGKLDGYFLEFYQSGYVCRNGKYSKGEKDGRWIEFYENHQAKSEGYYVPGYNRYELNMEMDSVHIYNENDELLRVRKLDSIFVSALRGCVDVYGTIGMRFPVNAYRKDGTWKYWDQQGNLIKEEYWQSGELLGIRNY